MLRAVGARGSAELSTQKQPKKTNLVIDPRRFRARPAIPRDSKLGSSHDRNFSRAAASVQAERLSQKREDAERSDHGYP